MLKFSVKLDGVFRKIGDGGFEILIFLTAFAVHIACALIFGLSGEPLSMSPEEFGLFSWASFFSGNDFGGVIAASPCYFGWGGALFYAPVTALFKNPFIQYQLVLIINSGFAALIPLIAYKLSNRLGVEQAWKRLLIAIVCGFYPSVFAHSKFAWSEIYRFVFPWLIVMILLAAFDAKSRAVKHVLSGVLALALTFSVVANEYNLSLLVSAVLVIVLSRLLYKNKAVCLRTFFPALLIFGALFYRITVDLNYALRGDVPSLKFFNNVPDGFDLGIKLLLKGDSNAWNSLLQTSAGHLYYFGVSSWGLGILALCLFIGFFFAVKSKERSKLNRKFLMFSSFAFLALLFGGVQSVLYKFNSLGEYDETAYQDALMSGRFSDALMPLILAAFLSYIFLRGLDLKRILPSIILSGGIYALFFATASKTVAEAQNINVSSILGLFPLRIGEKVDALITSDGLFLAASAAFSAMALLIVFVCCSPPDIRVKIISISTGALTLYSAVFSALVYLPFIKEQAETANAPAYAVSEYIYNSSDAPPAVFLEDEYSRTAAFAQFLNPDATVNIGLKNNVFPENCFVISPEPLEFSADLAEEIDFELLGDTGEYIIYAYGERAVMYANSQKS